MSPVEFLSTTPFIGSNEGENEKVALLGVGFDGTTSYRPGTRFGPGSIRTASDGLELYSPLLDFDLEEVNYKDLGDLDIPFGDVNETMTIIRNAISHLLPHYRIVTLGGEHSITFPIIESYLTKYPDLVIFQFDAHCDLRAEYKNVPYSHACVMYHILQKVGKDRMFQIGLRSGTKDEFHLAKDTLLKNPKELLPPIIKNLNDTPIYITVDLDVLDPSVFPGTGTPEPGGFRFNELINLLHIFSGCNIVGCDAVELSPDYDSSGISSITAAKVVRELLALTFLNSQLTTK